MDSLLKIFEVFHIIEHHQIIIFSKSDKYIKHNI